MYVYEEIGSTFGHPRVIGGPGGEKIVREIELSMGHGGQMNSPEIENRGSAGLELWRQEGKK